MSSAGDDPKVVLVTGASSGIGQSVALEFARLGYKVAITGRSQKRLDETIELLTASSPSKQAGWFLALNANFEEPAQVEPIVGETVGKFGRLDVVVNNAGYGGSWRSIRADDFFEDFQRILQVNLVAAMRVAQLSVPHLEKTKGVIINVSSIADRLGMPGISYCVSKAGMSMMGKALANAVGRRGIRVVNVCPGPVKTNFARNIERTGPMTSVNRVGESQEVADLIAYLASDKAAFITGCSMDIDGGFLNRQVGVSEMSSVIDTARPVDQ